MSGFSGIWIFDQKLKSKSRGFSFPENLHGFFPLIQKIDAADFRLAWYSIKKFPEDSFVSNTDEVFMGLDGVVLNNRPKPDFIQSIKDFETAISKTQGSFLAFFKDRSGLSIFADQTGSRQLFYYWDQRFFAFSSSIFLLTDILRHFGVSFNLSVPASYMMLSLGYLLEDLSLVAEIKKVKAGHYIRVSDKEVSIEKYHDFYRKTEHQTINQELLLELDQRFKTAVHLEYEKDLSNHYYHLGTLSGGLDSRLNVMLAHKYGFKNITCLTFSEGFKSDELTARKISKDLSLKHMVLLLNSGFQIYDLKTPLVLNNCSVYYFGAAQTLAAVKNINFSAFGLFHNGGLAESSKGGYLSGKEHRDPALSKRYAVSDKLFDRIDKPLLNKFLGSYQNEEMFITYNRGFNAIHNGSWMTMPFTDSVSTYMDLSFADLAYSINPGLKYNGYFTVEWIKRLHPELGKYPWRHGQKPTNNKALIFKARLINKLNQIIASNHDSPVPFNQWYTSNPELRAFIHDQYYKSAAWQMLPKEIEPNVRNLYLNGTVAEKLLCVSFLKSIELLFNLVN